MPRLRRASLPLLALLLTAPLLACSGAQAHDEHHGMQHDFSDAARWAARFEGPERDAWQQPGALISLMGLSSGMTVADVGAGTGYFLPHLLDAVGGTGRVLAVDVEPALVEHMRDRAVMAGWRNVEVLLTQPDDPALPPRSVDRVLIVNVWHHIEARHAYAAHLAEALTDDGALFIVDFTMDSPQGPPPEHRLLPEEILSELEGAGLDAQLLSESLPMQYVVVARRRR